MRLVFTGGPSKGDSSKGNGYTDASNGGAGEPLYQIPIQQHSSMHVQRDIISLSSGSS